MQTSLTWKYNTENTKKMQNWK